MNRRLAAIAALLVACVLAGLAAGSTSASTSPSLPSREHLTVARSEFLRLAKEGVRQARARWWNAQAGWYNDHLETQWSRHMPLARLWTAFPLFETLNAIAIAEPTPANRAAVRSFAASARRYWNPTLKPVGGFAYYIDTHRPSVNAYFDDNGWWGIAFLDAYRATGDRAYLREAIRAYRFIVATGWATLDGGGTWWDTRHHHKTAEPLAAAAYIGAKLYRATRDRAYLQKTREWIAWADAYSWNADSSLYQRNEIDSTVMDYVQGMMIGARLELCRATGRPSDCRSAQKLAATSLAAFPPGRKGTPEAPAIYLRFLLDLSAHDGDPRWYAAAYLDALRAATKARVGKLYLRTWSGRRIGSGLLRVHASTLSLFAWMAATPLPRDTA